MHLQLNWIASPRVTCYYLVAGLCTVSSFSQPQRYLVVKSYMRCYHVFSLILLYSFNLATFFFTSNFLLHSLILVSLFLTENILLIVFYIVILHFIDLLLFILKFAAIGFLCFASYDVTFSVMLLWVTKSNYIFIPPFFYFLNFYFKK